MASIKIVIVDDHKIIRDGLIAILKDDPSVDVIGDVPSGDELLLLLKDHDVDVILLDMHMPLKSGVEVTREVKVLYPRFEDPDQYHVRNTGRD